MEYSLGGRIIWENRRTLYVVVWVSLSGLPPKPPTNTTNEDMDHLFFLGTRQVLKLLWESVKRCGI